MYELIVFLSLITSCLFILRAFRIKSGVEYVFVFFLLFSAQIIFIGYILSSLNRLGEVQSWAAVGLVIVIISAGLLRWIKSPYDGDGSTPRSIRIIWLELFGSLSSFEKPLLVLLAITSAVIQILSLLVIFFIEN